MEQKTNRKWSLEEEEVALRYVKANPYNLHKCFMLISEHLTEAGTPRTPSAIQAHWYTVLSKRDNSLCFFTASAKHVSRNRKNGTGVQITSTIWQKFMRILRKYVPA